MTAQFNIPSTIITGAGASTELVPQLARLGANRVLLVTDAFMVSSGLAVRFQSAMLNTGLHVVKFEGVQPDPTDANVREGARRFAEEKCDAIVALGGGSPMDAAKAVAILATNGEPLSRFQGYHRVERAGVPLS